MPDLRLRAADAGEAVTAEDIAEWEAFQEAFFADLAPEPAILETTKASGAKGKAKAKTKARTPEDLFAVGIGLLQSRFKWFPVKLVALVGKWFTPEDSQCSIKECCFSI